ncbi:DOA4-independent degradation protein 4 [Penicillium diatomitis]|uniref:DOA4-independent degradation protein 4 n=1 Tax=Penicillium diatomitis TaxID=2819901 RepID=A0A9W9XE76_9EURO|nr:DOA4-independent degradation protein 4 [Penicillium diatomitis]KAJ5489112.1 DOA4-independent degradation protein 4 [Penicillium diatomitis]
MNIVEWAFGKRMTPAERLRKHQRALDRTQRELDRERTKLENQEKKLIQDIKKSAKNGQIGACKIQAKDLLYSEILPNADAITSHLAKNSGTSHVLNLPEAYVKKLTMDTRQTVRSNEQMMQSMKGATMLLGSMNRQMNLPALQRITMEFERENEIMDERQEMMDDAIDEATGMEDDEAEGEDIVKEVLDEIGVDLTQAVRKPSVPTLLLDILTVPSQLGETPSGEIQRESASNVRVAQAIGGGGGGGGAPDAGDDDLQARLDSLRR